MRSHTSRDHPILDPLNPLSNTQSTRPVQALRLRTLQHRLNHAIPNLNSLSEPRLKEPLRVDKPLLPGLKVAKPNTLGPAARRKRELKILTTERVVLDSDAQRLVEPRRAAEQVLRHAEPEPEQRRAAEHVVVRHDAQRAPAVRHSQQAEVVIRQRREVRGALADAELVEHGVAQQRRVRPLAHVVGAEHLLLGLQHARAELGAVAAQHQREELRHRLGVLVDLLAGLGVQDREPGVHVPLLAVDAHREVDLDVLDPAHVARALPGELP